MKILSFSEYAALHVEEPVTFSVDAEDAVNRIKRNSKQSLHWLALPVEDAIYGSRKNALADYCAYKNIQKIYALFSSLKEKREVFAATPSAADIQVIEGKCALRAYTVIPEPGYFQILSDGDFYFIFLGTREFFSAALNVEWEQGMKDFATGVARYSADRHERYHLTKVLRACEKFNSGGAA